jgi:uncharacterized protein (TIGR00661 family)
MNQPIRKLFYAVLNMGLGHATRSLPLIRAFQARGWQVHVGSSGRSLHLLQQELPDASFLKLPDYHLEYSQRGADLPRLMARAPAMLRTIGRETEMLADFVRDSGIDLVISDHRYGCFSESVPCFYLSHQLRFIAPGALRPFEFLGAGFNARFHRRYQGVIVPDLLEGGQGMLSGRLSRSKESGDLHYPGVLSSVKRRDDLEEDIDVLVSISGPEPQRTELERIALAQIGQVPGRKVVALGIPETSHVESVDTDLVVYDHLDRTQMEGFMNRSKLIVARSGYSTVMEIAELGKKALFIPTPGQTEQVYLARRFETRGWFHSAEQGRLDLKKNIETASRYSGFPESFSTDQTLDSLMPIFVGAAD